MTRAPIVACALLLAIACGRDERPDVVVIVLDTVRADHLSVYGYARATTPNLEAFAREAMTYRTAIAPDTWTGPSHASLLTGLASSEHGVRYAKERPGDGIHALPASVPTLTERLRDAGYRTAAFLGNEGYLDPVFGFDRGFERYQWTNLRPANRLVSAVDAWLRRRRGRSVFLLVNVLDAHEPYAAPPPYDRLFPGRLDRTLPRHLDGRTLPDPAETAHYVSQYDGELRFIDDGLGTIFQALRDTGRWDNALIVVTADHGELFGEDGRWGHGGEPIHPLVHVPLLIKYPQSARRGIDERPVSVTDVAPTILAVLGLPPLASGQVPLWDRTAPVVAEHVTADGITRLVYDADGSVRRERVAGTPRLSGPLVFPEADRRLADRLRALGYVE